MIGNHSHPGIVALATPQLGVRLLTHWRELGLTEDQLHRAIDLCRNWTDRCAQLEAEIVPLGVKIDRELCGTVDRNLINELAAQRRVLVHQLEDEFFDAWGAVRAIMDDQQYNKLFDIYRAEFANLPHPIFGTTQFELSER